MQIVIGHRYNTASGHIAKVLAKHNSSFVGVINPDTFDMQAVLWDTWGDAITPQHGSRADLVSEVVAGQSEWDKLQPFEKEAVRALVIALRSKKITGIKYLRSMHGWGLLEAKNIFEGVCDGTIK
jgi:hypothetical protein